MSKIELDKIGDQLNQKLIFPTFLPPLADQPDLPHLAWTAGIGLLGYGLGAWISEMMQDNKIRLGAVVGEAALLFVFNYYGLFSEAKFDVLNPYIVGLALGHLSRLDFQTRPKPMVIK